MLLSEWYANWKEKRIQAAAKEAKAKGYKEGYAAGKSGTPNRTGNTVAYGRKGNNVVKTTGKGK